jgi:hypothetical protein
MGVLERNNRQTCGRDVIDQGFRGRMPGSHRLGMASSQSGHPSAPSGFSEVPSQQSVWHVFPRGFWHPSVDIIGAGGSFCAPEVPGASFETPEEGVSSPGTGWVELPFPCDDEPDLSLEQATKTPAKEIPRTARVVRVRRIILAAFEAGFVSPHDGGRAVLWGRPSFL